MFWFENRFATLTGHLVWFHILFLILPTNGVYLVVFENRYASLQHRTHTAHKYDCPPFITRSKILIRIELLPLFFKAEKKRYAQPKQMYNEWVMKVLLPCSQFMQCFWLAHYTYCTSQNSFWDKTLLLKSCTKIHVKSIDIISLISLF